MGFFLFGVSTTAHASDLRFTDITKQSGIDFTMTCGRMPAREIIEVDGGGVALFDFDNDGDLDLFFANGATMDDPEHGPGSRLYANRGDGTFEDVTAKSGINLKRWAMGAAVGDVDGDGRDDLYVTCYGPDVLLKNETTKQSGPRFRDVTREAGIQDDRWTTSAGFGDLDNDGDLDLYAVNYLKFDVKNPPDRTGKVFKGVPVMAGPAGLTAEDDILYENVGNGKFRDITKEAGITENPPGYGLGVRIFDFDNDGQLDIFVGNDSSGNYLFRNVSKSNQSPNHQITKSPNTSAPSSSNSLNFEDVAVAAGVFANLEGTTQASMGLGLGDIDGNGHADLFTANFSSDTNTLFLNLGDGFFDDRTAQFGLGLVSRPFLSWGCGFYDFDLDGDEDLFIASGHVYPETAAHKMDTEYAQDLLMFERKEKRFERVIDCGDMFAKKFHGRSCAFGDIDNDGDVDVIMTTLNGPVHVFRNDQNPPRKWGAGEPPTSAPGAGPVDGRSWLTVELIGARGNHRAYGSRVELVTPAGTQRRWITGGGSYQSADAPYTYFGVGTAIEAATCTLRVRFPDGRSVERPIDRWNQRLKINQ